MRELEFEWDTEKNRINKAKHDDVIRIISARRATNKERRFYEEYNGGWKDEKRI